MDLITGNNRKFSLLIAALCLFLAYSQPVLAAGAGRSGDAQLVGRDFIRMGSLAELSGVLEQTAGEWYLINDEGRFSLHMGPTEYLAAIDVKLKEGADVSVKGWKYNQDFSVGLLTTGGRSVVLRDETGRPAWSGTGFSQGRNRGAGMGRGMRINQ